MTTPSDLRQLAGRITAPTGLAPDARARPALLATALADRVDAITRHTDHLRHDNTR